MDSTPSALDAERAATAPPRSHTSNGMVAATAIAAVADKAAAFTQLSLDQRLGLARATLAGLAKVGPALFDGASAAKGLTKDGPVAGAEWLSGPVAILATARRLVHTLERGARGRPAASRSAFVKRPDGRVALAVPSEVGTPSALPLGPSATVLFSAGTSLEEARRPRPNPNSSVGVKGIVASSETASTAAIDTLHALFVEGRATVLELGPTNAYQAPLLEQALSPVVEAGYLRILVSAGEPGAELSTNPAVTALHVAGPVASAAVVARDGLTVSESAPGPGRLLVMPWLYSSDEISFVARRLASEILASASISASAPRLILLPRGFRQRKLFLDHLEKALSAIPARRASSRAEVERYEQLTAHAEGMRRATYDPTSQSLPWTLLTEIDPKLPHEQIVPPTDCPAVLHVSSIGSDDPIEFLQQAVDIANGDLALSTEIIVHPMLRDSPDVARAIEDAEARLRTSLVGINEWPGMAYPMGLAPGGFTCLPSLEPQPPIGVSHDALGLDRVDKVVLEGHLRAFVRPGYSYEQRRARVLGEQLCKLAAEPSVSGRVALAWTAMRG